MPRSKGKAHASKGVNKDKAQASKGIKEDNAEASKGGNEDKAEESSIKVTYLESGFECSIPVVPGDLQRSIQRAQLLGVKKAAEKVGVPKKYLSARPLGPLEKEDGSFFSVEEWASRFVVAVESKDPMFGLLQRCNDLDQVLKGGVEDVYISEPASSAHIDSELLKENQTLKEENAVLRSQLFTLETSYEGLQKEIQKNPLSQQIVRLQKEKEALQKVSDTLTTENGRLKLENDMLKIDNVSLKIQVEQLQVRVTRLESASASQEKEILELKTMLAALSTIEMVLIRKMVDECRGKCKTIITDAGLQVPVNWNDVGKHNTLVALLSSRGLTEEGLKATEYGWGTVQNIGNRAAHKITEDIRLYAYVTCRMKGTLRKMVLDVFEFTFGQPAESVAFE